MEQGISLGPDGMFRRDGAVFVPVGVAYRPAQGTSRAAIGTELAAIAASGLNAVRVRTGTEQAAVREAGAHGLAIFCDEASDPDGLQALSFIPQPGTHLLGFDGLADPFSHTLLPFVVRRVRAHGPAMVASLGFGAVLGAAREDAWLRVVLPAIRGAGAAGVFWRELRGSDGLWDAAGRVRPGREYFCTWARGAADEVGADPRPPVGLLIPEAARLDADCERRLLLAHYFLGVIGRAWQPVTVAQLATGWTHPVLTCGPTIAKSEVGTVRTWVEAGGELFWHGPDALAWDEALAALLGARPLDWRSGRGISVNTFGERFTLAHFPHDVRAELEPTGAQVLAADHQGQPLVLENRLGNGRVRYALPIVEDAIVPVAAHPPARDRWASWYRGMLGA